MSLQTGDQFGNFKVFDGATKVSKATRREAFDEPELVTFATNAMEFKFVHSSFALSHEAPSVKNCHEVVERRNLNSISSTESTKTHNALPASTSATSFNSITKQQPMSSHDLQWTTRSTTTTIIHRGNITTQPIIPKFFRRPCQHSRMIFPSTVQLSELRRPATTATFICHQSHQAIRQARCCRVQIDSP